MLITMREAERWATALFQAAGVDAEDSFAVADLTRPVLGTTPRIGCITEDWRVARADSGRWRILVRRDLVEVPAFGRYAAAKALAWHILRVHQLPTPLPDDETVRRFAGAVLCPLVAFERAVARLGEDPQALARAFCVPVPLALLRIGEVCGRRVAYVDHDLIRMRGRGSGTMHRVRLDSDPDLLRHGLIFD